MSVTLVRLSTAVLTGVRKSTHISRTLSANSDVPSSSPSTSSSSEKATLLFPGLFHSASIDFANQRTPTPTEVHSSVKEWESTINTEQLTDMEMRIHEAHMQAVLGGEEMYPDPVTNFHVYSAYGHLKRGSCCGNACRHCPYDHQHVAPRYKSVKKNNGAFYS